MADDEDQAQAAVALLLMGDRGDSKQVLDVVRAEWRLPEIASDGLDIRAYFTSRIKLHSVVAEKQQQLTKRAMREWEQITLFEKGLQRGGPANGSQPIRSGTDSTLPAAGSRR